MALSGKLFRGQEFWEGKAHLLSKGMLVLPISLAWPVVDPLGRSFIAGMFQVISWSVRSAPNPEMPSSWLEGNGFPFMGLSCCSFTRLLFKIAAFSFEQRPEVLDQDLRRVGSFPRLLETLSSGLRSPWWLW